MVLGDDQLKIASYAIRVNIKNTGGSCVSDPPAPPILGPEPLRGSVVCPSPRCITCSEITECLGYLLCVNGKRRIVG